MFVQLLKHVSLLALLGSALWQTGCALVPRAPASAESARPAWIERPGDGVSASAGFHARGEFAQEELAIARAREELAKRYGISVSSELVMVQTATANSVSTTADKTSRESMSGNIVRATVKEKWRDPATGALWVWVVSVP